MSVPPTSPAAGWYPAPDGSPTVWWWDGVRWTPPGQQPGRRLSSANRLAKLALTTRALLIVCGVVSLVTVGVEAFGISAMTIYLNGQDSAIGLLDSYDQITVAVSVLSVVALVGTGVIWLLWQYAAAKQVSGLTRRSPGWHVGSWLVPIICVWFPYQNISDLWQAAGRSRPAWQAVWWTCWLASNAVIQLSSRIYTVAQDLDQLRVALLASIAGEILLLVAAPLAWLIVRDITQSIIQRSATHHDAGELTTA